MCAMRVEAAYVDKRYVTFFLNDASSVSWVGLGPNPLIIWNVRVAYPRVLPRAVFGSSREQREKLLFDACVN